MNVTLPDYDYDEDDDGGDDDDDDISMIKRMMIPIGVMCV
jgi:hypothetical protein